MDASSSWCGPQGWGPWNENHISFTPCFLNSVVLGAPAVVASIAFILRAWHLERNKVPHGLGRTNLIYWPSQLALAVAIAALVRLLFLSSSTSLLSPSYAIGSLIVAWVLAIRLNRLEWKYEIRSSSLIFFFELLSIMASAVTQFSLYTQDQSGQDTFRTLTIYTIAIATAFAFEAFPRGSTRVQKLSNANGHDKANNFSRWTFHYLDFMVSLGFKRTLVREDIAEIMPKDIEAEAGYRKIAANWEAHKREVERANAAASPEQLSKNGPRKPDLFRVIAMTFLPDYIAMVAYHLLGSSFQLTLPILVQQILIYIESEEELPVARGILLAVAMLLVSISISFSLGQFRKQETELGLAIRGGLVSMIYHKALVLAPSSKSSIGEATNHMSTDVERWPDRLHSFAYWVVIPFEITVCSIMLYNVLGWSALCGLACIIISTPIQGRVGEFLDEAGDEKLGATDRRIQVMSEVLANIKIIKLYAYEDTFRSKIETHRNEELRIMRKTGLVLAVLSLVYTCFPYLMAFISFAVYATVGGPNFTPGVMSAQVVFVSLTLFSLLLRPVGLMSIVMESTVAIRVATRRIQKFLLKEELSPRNVDREDSLPKDKNASVIMLENATFAWNSGKQQEEEEGSDEGSDDDEEEATETTALLADSSSSSAQSSNEPTLIDINLRIARGHLTAIVGRVGQGKSSLLSALIGDMFRVQGVAKVWGSIAYVPQQAWIINASIRDNIVFGKPFDQERYDHILYASGLLPDLEILAAGDQTEIGERGINLSGGQKQRLSLARAAYQDADIYLLDDPLSAVDAHVDQHLWKHLIGPDGLLKNKTRVLVTHGIHHLEQVDYIAVIKDGQVSEKGTYKSLMKAKGVFCQLIKEFSVNNGTTKKNKTLAPSSPSSSSISEAETCTIAEDDKADGSKANASESSDAGELVEEEELGEGVVSWKTVVSYCKLVSFGYMVFLLLTYVVWQGLQLSVPFWLEHWTSVADTTKHTIVYFLGIYGVLLVLYMAVDVYLTYINTVDMPLRGSKALHEILLAKVLRLPMAFFDTTPQGRVLNRFSNDISKLDEHIPEALLTFLANAFNLLGGLFVLSIVTPMILLVIPVLAFLYWLVHVYFIRTSTIVKRLESTSKSPLYQHFTETLNGLSSIRALNIKDLFTAKNDSHANASSNANYAVHMLNGWLGLRLETLAAIAIFSACILIVLSKDSLSASMSGLALNSLIQITSHTIWTLRSYCDLQGELVAIERLNQYANKRTEAPVETGVYLPDQWPQHGQITFKNYSTRYREGLDLVMKNVSFKVEPSEKVGIVGRTGAGKSSLTLALFRIIEAADSYWAKASDQSLTDDDEIVMNQSISPILLEGGGSIEIDGVDIATIGLRTLRLHLAIIPQDPTLFAGTVRDNLDPSGESTDRDLWEALERAHLKDHISTLPGGLSFEVAQNGDNFS
ncbi:hypothetical protein BGZ94_003045, partial [Podila epigama]